MYYIFFPPQMEETIIISPSIILDSHSMFESCDITIHIFFLFSLITYLCLFWV